MNSIVITKDEIYKAFPINGEYNQHFLRILKTRGAPIQSTDGDTWLWKNENYHWQQATCSITEQITVTWREKIDEDAA